MSNPEPDVGYQDDDFWDQDWDLPDFGEEADERSWVMPEDELERW
jgi:hypothetical protein